MKVIEDLQLNGLSIVVDKAGFTYGSDAVLLANFANPRRGDSCLDLGAGTGILAILVNGKTGARFTAVEIQQAACQLMEESIALNGQGGDITVLHADIRKLGELLPAGSFDGAVCNPPYFSGGTRSGNPAVALCVHQDECGIYDVARCAGRLLKNGGCAIPPPALRSASTPWWKAGFSQSGCGSSMEKTAPTSPLWNA